MVHYLTFLGIFVYVLESYLNTFRLRVILPLSQEQFCLLLLGIGRTSNLELHYTKFSLRFSEPFRWFKAGLLSVSGLARCWLSPWVHPFLSQPKAGVVYCGLHPWWILASYFCFPNLKRVGKVTQSHLAATSESTKTALNAWLASGSPCSTGSGDLSLCFRYFLLLWKCLWWIYSHLHWEALIAMFVINENLFIV